MSKTYSDQVEKATMLVAGLRRNFSEVESRGISREQIDRLEAAASEAARLNAEVEALRAQVSERAAIANKKLAEVKNGIQNAKVIVKRCIDQPRWPDFGVMDKR